MQATAQLSSYWTETRAGHLLTDRGSTAGHGVLPCDSYVPRTFLRMGDRLAFSHGITALAVVAAAVFVGFDGKTDALIPLYAVGVFLVFTLARSGMVVQWRRHRERH